MTLQNTGTNVQRTRDELSSEPDIQPIYKVKSELIQVEEGATQVCTETIGNSFILGHPLNGVLGSPALGDNGLQDRDWETL